MYSPEGICPALNTVDGGNLEPKIALVRKRTEELKKIRFTADGFHLCRNDKKRSSIQGTHVTSIYGKTHCIGTTHVPMCIKPVLTPDRIIKRQNGRRMKENGEPSFTLTAQDKHGIYDGQAIRKLTPLECERLQGFPDGWTEYGADGRKMSDSARYKALGNAVTVNFPRMIGEKLR